MLSAVASQAAKRDQAGKPPTLGAALFVAACTFYAVFHYLTVQL